MIFTKKKEHYDVSLLYTTKNASCNAAKGPIWDHFLAGERQNNSHVHAYTEEAHLMELLADEEEDHERIPDDGELEGSGDNFDGRNKMSILGQILNNPLETCLNKGHN